MTDSADYTSWIGRQETLADVLDPARTNALRAALGDVAPLAPGDPLPLLHHWLYFWDVRPPAGLGIDGHPRAAGSCRRWRCRGGCGPAGGSPSIARCWWARGSPARRPSATSPPRAGAAATWCSSPSSTRWRTRRACRYRAAGHRLSRCRSARQHRRAGGARPAARRRMAQRGRSRRGAAVRYSGLTMNGHRIHYDRPYAMAEEAYPALVVHGPLQATLLIDLAVRPRPCADHRLHLPRSAAGVRRHPPAHLRRALGRRRGAVDAAGRGEEHGSERDLRLNASPRR